MNWTQFKTYGDSYTLAFETMCNQLFERHLRRTYPGLISKFYVIHGAGGDGGIEAYGQLNDGRIIAVQSKWFRDKIDIGQIKNSIVTAMTMRPGISEYIICIPRKITSSKIGRGGKVVENTDERRIHLLIEEIAASYPTLSITWWFELDLLIQLQLPDNEGIHKYWFDRELISFEYLKQKFESQCVEGWLKERYAADLNGAGKISDGYQKILFSSHYIADLFTDIKEFQVQLLNCCGLIRQFLIQKPSAQLEAGLVAIHDNLEEYILETCRFVDAIQREDRNYKYNSIPEEDLWPVKMLLANTRPTNLQKPIYKPLEYALDSIDSLAINQYLNSINERFTKYVLFVLGAPGTGKTHGLASCMDHHLQFGNPGIILHAKGAACGDWTKLLTNALELPEWRKEEVLSALEALAVRSDICIPTNLNQFAGSVLIAVDGLEEDILQEKIWYDRIRESELLVKRFPRTRFIFSARNNFFNHSEIEHSKLVEVLHIPQEGDIPVKEAAKLYFKPEHYNIQLASYDLIDGIDSLFALKLFCEKYKNQELSSTDKLVTATEELLNLKIEQIEIEFKTSIALTGKTQAPVKVALLIIAEAFYKDSELEHTHLIELLIPVLDKLLNGNQMDLLLESLCTHGILSRQEKIVKKGVVKTSHFYYNISYQSLIEHILASNIYEEIVLGKLDHIPKLLRAFKYPLGHLPMHQKELPPNQKIIQNIVNRFFTERERLIGEGGFLVKGFSNEAIFNLQMEAIFSAPPSLAIRFKSYIDELFFENGNTRYKVFKELILPSCGNSSKPFGSKYLHSILIKLSCFERDKLWSGLDKYETRNLKEDDTKTRAMTNLGYAFDKFGMGIILPDSDLFDERPLVYAWGLSNIDQNIRYKLRVALTGWAILNCQEFIKLLDVVLICNDPQIQEDLASIVLGVSSKIIDPSSIKDLAKWTIENIFINKEIYRNVIVRQGFRAIVERAYLLNLITLKEVILCRPSLSSKIELLPLNRNAITNPAKEIYPIVHDLAWYVIENAFRNFLEYPENIDGKLLSKDSNQAKALLDLYRVRYKKTSIYGRSWCMSAAITYIQSLGFDRTEGSWYTDASHGSKSKVFTYEEKYTWLAVHYLMGYLSDYIPLLDTGNIVSDYYEIVDIPNPAEHLPETSIKRIFEKDTHWIIPEELSPTLIIEGDLQQSILNWSNAEPKLNFEKWISFPGQSLYEPLKSNDWTLLYGYQSLFDSTNFVGSMLTFYASAVPVKLLKNVVRIMKDNPDSMDFVHHFDLLETSPDVNFYCNPSDIVWMHWLGELDNKIELNCDEDVMYKTVSKLTQSHKGKEKSYYIPAKIIRETLKIKSLQEPFLLDEHGNIVACIHECSDGNYRGDSQYLMLADTKKLQNNLAKKGMTLVWFGQLFREKNPLEKSLPKDLDSAWKTRKYIFWKEKEALKQYKFWDERTSNIRDRIEKEQELYDHLSKEERFKHFMKRITNKD